MGKLGKKLLLLANGRRSRPRHGGCLRLSGAEVLFSATECFV